MLPWRQIRSLLAGPGQQNLSSILPDFARDVVADARRNDGSTGVFLLRMYAYIHIVHQNGIGGARKSVLCLFEMDLWA